MIYTSIQRIPYKPNGIVFGGASLVAPFYDGKLRIRLFGDVEKLRNIRNCVLSKINAIK